MEVFVLIAQFLNTAMWVVLSAIGCLGVLLCFSKRTRLFGAAMAFASFGYMAYIFFTPDLLRMVQKPLEETSLRKADFPIPSVLVLHGSDFDFGGETSSYDVQDLLTLAETGLFRVVLAGNAADAPVLGEAVLAYRGDCAELRSRPAKDDFGAPPKLGALLFAARTGFQRCAIYVKGPVPLPPRRLDLWKDVPHNYMEKKRPEDLRGIMTLSLIENGQQRDIAQRVTRSRAVPLSRWGFYTYNSKPEYWDYGGAREYDPDVLEFVLAALHVEQASLPRNRLSDAELVGRAGAIIHQVTTPTQKLRVAFSLAGAVHANPQMSRTILQNVSTAFAEFRRLWMVGFPTVRVQSDCQTALHVALGRQVLAPVCEQHASPPAAGDCVLPDRLLGMEDRCTDLRKTVWDGEEKGLRTLIVGRGRGAGNSRIAISNPNNPAELRRIVIHPQQGLIDIALFDETNQSIIWTFDGSLGCLDRVTVIGKKSGVVGVEPGRVQFRDRFDELDHFLGQKPQSTMTTPSGTPTFVGDAGQRRAPCRDMTTVPPATSLIPDQVVTRLPDLAFRAR